MGDEDGQPEEAGIVLGGSCQPSEQGCQQIVGQFAPGIDAGGEGEAGREEESGEDVAGRVMGVSNVQERDGKDCGGDYGRSPADEFLGGDVEGGDSQSARQNADEPGRDDADVVPTRVEDAPLEEIGEDVE